MSASPRARRISVRSVVDAGTPVGRRLCRLAPLLDRVLGINELDELYHRNALAGLPPHRFATEALQSLGATVAGGDDMANRLPTEGPVIVVANHPHGGIEGLIMVQLIAALRPDVKIMANLALGVFKELTPNFLFVNPLNASDPTNGRGLRESLRQLRSGGVLVMFPAGRTSFYQADLGCIADSEWSRATTILARKTGAPILPMRFTGRNSKLFYRLGDVWYRFRLLMLARELLNTRNKTVELVVGRPFDPELFSGVEDATLTDVMRLATTTLQPARTSQPSRPAVEPYKLAPAGDRSLIAAELEALPRAQRVLETRGFIVGFGNQAQFPNLMADIARERERTFRMLDEGSGAPTDSDAFDADFDQLYCWDQSSEALVGAYRIGRRDRLLAGTGSYLEQMFDFDPAFFAERAPALELGRSFVTPPFQRSRHSLDFLWRGIGGYLRAHPHYGTLYGTVSLSRQYDPVSIAMMAATLIAPGDRKVRARQAMEDVLGSEWQRFCLRHDVDLALLNALVAAREQDGKSIPVLLRHYAGLGAEFHAVGVDSNFAATPGLLLSVDLSALPAAKHKRYIAHRPY
ncbi:MAG: lysophospholipid acyltransferase family protein [Gammaproteobacteria bacterium]